jgi:hypothetical protein
MGGALANPASGLEDDLVRVSDRVRMARNSAVIRRGIGHGTEIVDEHRQLLHALAAKISAKEGMNRFFKLDV